MNRILAGTTLPFITALVLAHALLIEADPPPNATLKTPPKEVVLRFDAPVRESYLALAVIDLKRKRRVDRRDVHRDPGDGSVVRATLKQPLPPGEYLVRYRVQAQDTHIMTGQYPFKIAGGASAGRPKEEAPPIWKRLLLWLKDLLGIE